MLLGVTVTEEKAVCQWLLELLLLLLLLLQMQKSGVQAVVAAATTMGAHHATMAPQTRHSNPLKIIKIVSAAKGICVRLTTGRLTVTRMHATKTLRSRR